MFVKGSDAPKVFTASTLFIIMTTSSVRQAYGALHVAFNLQYLTERMSSMCLFGARAVLVFHQVASAGVLCLDGSTPTFRVVLM